MGSIVEVERVTFSYELRDQGVRIPLLKDFSLNVEAGEIVGVVGPSGCGKSTIARLIAGLLFPQTGSVLFRGHRVVAPGRERGLLAQGDWCLPWFTVGTNIRLGVADSAKRGQMDELLRIAGLTDVMDKYPGSLSFGTRQRVSLVRALVAGADLLILDEPLSSVDAVRKLSLEQWIRMTLKTTGVSGFWITHDLDEALLVSDRLFVVGGKPLSILHEEAVQRASEDIQSTILLPEFQERRLALQRRVIEMWPSEGDIGGR